ncbi:TetR family transcriptional regulator [Nocardia pseudovaccinii]|uniref:TetR family transcriptional regulator n=1 Tax=Nocardia pseudovaccinii TaxID=189540 RepID=UPI0007A458B2|nr:TetR family transcriptional regulator [Nocardia pseudovaccinii]
MPEHESARTGSGDTGAGHLVRRARTAAGVSLRELARLIGVSAGTLSAVENGKTPLTVDRLDRIAAELGVSTVDILATRLPSAADATGSSPARSAGDGQTWRTFEPLVLDPVLDAAIAAFMQTGYHGATMRSIAATAGMSVAGVYHYYPSKQDLLVAIFDLGMSELLWRIPAARDDGVTAVERFAKMVEALALFHAYRGDLAFIGASEMRSFDEPNRSRVAAQRVDIQRMIDDEVAAGIRAGEFTTRYPREAARAVATMCTSLPQWFRPVGPISRQQIAVEYAQFAVDIMRGRNPSPHSPGFFRESVSR